MENTLVETSVVDAVKLKKREQRRQQRQYKSRLLKNFKKLSNDNKHLVIQKVYTEDKCNICLDNAGQRFTTLCGHIFHEKCIKEWVNVNNSCPSCPVCKSVI